MSCDKKALSRAFVDIPVYRLTGKKGNFKQMTSDSGSSCEIMPKNMFRLELSPLKAVAFATRYPNTNHIYWFSCNFDNSQAKRNMSTIIDPMKVILTGAFNVESSNFENLTI